MKEQAYIYFLSNAHNNVLYIGVTNDIIRRIAEHKAKINKGFTYKYNCNKLVYYETFKLIVDAIAREKQLKNWKREWKDKLVTDFNHEWKDFSEEIGVTNELIEAIRTMYDRHAELVSASTSSKGIAGQARNDGATCNDEHQIANQKAENEFELYRPIQDKLFLSDFDKQMLKLKENNESN